MGLTDERLAEALAELRRGNSSVASVRAARLSREQADAVLAEVGRLRGEQERLREALRRIASGDMVTKPVSDPHADVIDGIPAEVVYVVAQTAQNIAREALVGEQDTTTTPNLRNASVSKETQEEA